MARCEHFCLNLANYSMQLMTLIIMELLHSHQLITVRESSPVEWREKSEYGGSVNLLKLWKHHLKSIEVELQISGSIRMTIKP